MEKIFHLLTIMMIIIFESYKVKVVYQYVYFQYVYYV